MQRNEGEEWGFLRGLPQTLELACMGALTRTVKVTKYGNDKSVDIQCTKDILSVERIATLHAVQFLRVNPPWVANQQRLEG